MLINIQNLHTFRFLSLNALKIRHESGNCMEKDLTVNPSKYLELLQEPINQKYYINKTNKASTSDMAQMDSHNILARFTT